MATKTVDTRNIRLLLEYDGSRYDGWQKQGNTDNTIQGKLEQVLSRLEGAPVEVCGAGRTDAGVHAEGQVANVHLTGKDSPKQIMDYVNQYLPDDIRVLEASEVSERFHSRLNAAGKIYVYRVDMSPKGSVFERRYVYPLGQELDVEAMEQAAALLVGCHDFRSFCTGRYSGKSTVRTLESVRLVRGGEKNERLEMYFEGNGFLRNMVRILAGTLIETGLGKRRPESMTELLEAKDRSLAGFTAPAKGLTLVKVLY